MKNVSGNTLALTTDAGKQVTVTVVGGARVVQLAPGSTDLKTATPLELGEIAVGDRVLVTGKAGETADSFSATRVILMKGADIAQKRAGEQADWQRRGVGGIVTAVDGAGGVTISSGAKKIQVRTNSTTVFKRYGADSIKFEDAKPGTPAQIQAGDQFEVRGAKSEDGSSIQAEEVVSGSFRNLSGTLATVNASAGTVSLKDLTTKKMMTVTVTANSDLRKLPPEIAARFAARARGGMDAGASAGTTSPGVRTGPLPPGGSAPAGGTSAGTTASSPARADAAGQGAGSGRPTGAGRSAGLDLSKMLARLPAESMGDLHIGDAVMIVASETQPGNSTVTAVTLLAGVEPILAATPSGAQGMTLSPWSVGGGAPEGGGGAP